MGEADDEKTKLDSETRKDWLGIDGNIQQLTQIHLTFHSLVMVALGVLASNAHTSRARWLVVYLASVGAISVFVAIFRELRNDKLRSLWMKEHPAFEEICNNLPFKRVRSSRQILLVMLLLLYAGILVFPFFNQ